MRVICWLISVQAVLSQGANRTCTQCPTLASNKLSYLDLPLDERVVCFCGNEGKKVIDCAGRAPNANFPYEGNQCSISIVLNENGWINCIRQTQSKRLPNINKQIYDCAIAVDAIQTLSDGKTIPIRKPTPTTNSSPTSQNGAVQNNQEVQTNTIILISLAAVIFLLLTITVVYLYITKRKALQTESNSVVVVESGNAKLGNQCHDPHLDRSTTLNLFGRLEAPEKVGQHLYYFSDTGFDSVMNNVLQKYYPLNSPLKASAAYTPKEKEHLSFGKDDTLVIKQYLPDGWCQGINKITELEGKFPLSYVKSVHNLTVHLIDCQIGVNSNLLSIENKLNAIKIPYICHTLNWKELKRNESLLYPIFGKVLGNERCTVVGTVPFKTFLIAYLNRFGRTFWKDLKIDFI
ncbi:hypothetical protein BC833DRAFT_661600 [Globomyces pollinis-pini]|nr:hypothetical protein BC833DRAFT_661600 [Globomyces pollinis-pini]